MFLFYDTFWQVNMQLGVHAVCYLLRCVVEHIVKDLCFKASYTLAMACGTNSTAIYTVLYIKMVHISKCINKVLF